ncbi:hypothetical protein PPYR_15355 [Photinus pyralis]|uniref:Uncharacterized protein n=1 Tax=Photinus pyralis TaxID=7054 RepID=A0A5N3ZZ10_PHOPY|nr:uncharacterized protein LOC116163107 [Photinus pyralis]XP_031345630.1 uncharacterized protein LOC116172536 [Photinus pyralis]XP_031358749.1 uncharacterized protein LOC116182361 [Photinus pyralis]KAB0790307.1 hypothetical protein PPYR_15355 [Photinus pyralis]
MGRVLAIAAACSLHISGTYLFRTPSNLDCIPYETYLMFLVAVFYLLWNVPLNPYPSCFRSLRKPAGEIIEFLVAVLMVELLVSDFWCPLQLKFMTFIRTIPDNIYEAANVVGVDATCITDHLEILKSDGVLTVSSDALSLFFLVCALHSCKVVDLRLLKCGVPIFTKDISKRAVKFAKRFTAKKGSRRRRYSTDSELDWSTDSEGN